MPSVSTLSARELEIAQAYALGASYRQIAIRLCIAPSTVRAHVRAIYRKLGVSSKVSLLRTLEEAGCEAAGLPAIRSRVAETPHPLEHSIAVLPFDYMIERPECGHFADGIVEELTNALAHLPGLQVAAHTSAFCFRGANRDIREIGRALSVAYVVEGSVRCTPRQVRVTAQLIASDSGHHLWSERYTRPSGDVFEIQDDIVAAITASLRKLLPAGPQGS